MNPLKKLVFIIVLTACAVYVSIPGTSLNLKLGRFEISRKFELKLGLDLAGGSHLVFEADTTKIPLERKKEALTGARNIIERRVNLFGVSEPIVQTSSFGDNDRIIVELPGISDTKQAVDLIGKTAQLEFMEIVEIPNETSATPSAILSPTDLTGADLESARVDFEGNTGKPAISLQFTSAGGEKFAKLTKTNIGKPLPVVLDGEIITQPVVQEEIIGGQAQISGDFTIEEANALSIQLNAGALPLPIDLIEERTVGATLGTESINQSVTAGVVGLAMVFTFMILSYGGLGVVSGVGLLIFAAITMALYKLIPVTLTLPGIAGFMLSVGMAVDSNILIFERFKEEKLKRAIPEALEVSFGRAWDSIRDANIATLVTAFILANPLDWQFLHTSGPIRGFAITLALGIFISLFTGIFVSRNLLRVFVRDGKRQEVNGERKKL